MNAIYHPGQEYTDDEILHNRRVVVQYLQRPELKKAVGRLGKVSTGGRCCLCHICDAVGVVATEFKYTNIYEGEIYNLPDSVKTALGMYSVKGTFCDLGKFVGLVSVPRVQKPVYSLIELNDTTRISTQSIGKFLETNIMGGSYTPWKEIKTV